jgi:hypothetical protein
MPNNQFESFEYSDYLVGFLDVLGFSDLVRKSEKGKEAKKKIKKYFDTIYNELATLKQIGGKINLKSIVVSDSVVVSIPWRKGPDRVSILRHFCVAIAKIQYEMAKNDIWMRGAVSSGKAFIQEERNQVVGPAYIAAYKLESEIARYPRVVIDPKIISDLSVDTAQELINQVNDSTFVNWTTDIIFDWNKYRNLFFSFQQDTPLFIDYLSPLFNGQPSDRKLIINNIKNNIYKAKTYSKYRWLLDYLIYRSNGSDPLPDVPFTDELLNY